MEINVSRLLLSIKNYPKDYMDIDTISLLTRINGPINSYAGILVMETNDLGLVSHIYEVSKAKGQPLSYMRKFSNALHKRAEKLYKKCSLDLLESNPDIVQAYERFEGSLIVDDDAVYAKKQVDRFLSDYFQFYHKAASAMLEDVENSALFILGMKKRCSQNVCYDFYKATLPPKVSKNLIEKESE